MNALKLEVLIFKLYGLRVAAQEGLRHTQTNYVALLFYIEQNVKTTYVDILKYGATDQFETALQQRYREYDGIMGGSATIDRKLWRVGLSYAEHVGMWDEALMSWVSQTFVQDVQGFASELNRIDSQFELVSEASEEHKAGNSKEHEAGNADGAKGGAGCLVVLLILIGIVTIRNHC